MASRPLTSRLDGLPRTPDIEELTCWANAVPHLGDAIPEAAELLGKRSLGLGERFFHPDFPEKALSAHGSTLVSHFAGRARNSSPTNYSICHQVKD